MAKFRYSLDTGLSHVYLDVPLPYTIACGPSQTVIVEPVGPLLTLAAVADLLRVAEVTQMTGARTAVVPQTYFDAQVADAFSTDNHPVGDPLIPTCSIYTHKAIRSGNWSDPTMWDVGTTPHAAPDGTALVCSGEYDIVYDVFSDVRIKDIHINGRGSFKVLRTMRTRLWVDTLLVDGKLIIGEPGAPIIDSGIVTSSKRQPQCEMVFWQSEAPLKTARLGLVTSGPVRIQGAAKTSRLYATDTIAAGATTITFDDAPSGWQIGDEILITATEYGGTSATDTQYLGPNQHYNALQAAVRTRGTHMLSQDEVRTITDISGNTVTLNAPLTYAHNRYTRTLPHGEVIDLKPIVAVLTHSIRFRTADSNDTAIWSGANLSVRQKRAHMMFMLHDDVEIRYAEAKNMGRTDTDPSLATGSTIRYATSDTSTPISDANNVRGRYPWHIHRTGAYFGRKQVVLKSVSSWAPPAEYPIPGWAITHHDSRAAIEDCVVYNVRGAGIVSELGNETGQWINNTVAWCRGDGFTYDWGERQEIWENHNGHMGAAYENQARQILQQGNTAHSARVGWMYLQQDVNILKRIPDEHSLRFRDPITQGGGSFVNQDYGLDFDTYGVEEAQVPDFFDNHAYGCLDGFFKAHQQFTDRTDKTPFIFKRFHCINCNTAYAISNYTFVYYIYDSVWIGRDQGSSTGAFVGAVSWEQTFVNMRLERMNRGFVDTGLNIAYQCFWIDIGWGAGAWGVTTPFQGATNTDFGVDPTTKNTYGIMGPWTITGATTAIPRTWADITSASLPQPYPLAPFGPDSTFRTANPCPAVGEPPYVVVDPSSDLSVSPTGNATMSIAAFVVDSVGYRRVGDYQSPESGHSVMSPKGARVPLWTTGTEIAYRNGCFNDGGTWKSRLWFNDLDRATGDHFVYSIDVTLVGFDSGFLTANMVDPMATKPELPLLPEAIPETAIGAHETPVVVTSAAHNNIENELLAIVLRANTGLVRWAITGGADAVDFEVVFLSSQWVLRWASNGTKDYESPDDTGANNVYDVQVTCTSFAGVASAPFSIAVTVTDQIEAVPSFSDDFASPSGQFLDDRAGYVRTSGNANRLVLSGGAVRNEAGTGTTVYRLPDIGRTTDFVMRCKFPASGGPRLRAGVVPGGTGPRIVMYRDNGTSLLTVVFVNTAGTSVVWNYANPSTNLVTLELIGTTFRILYNGTVQTSTDNPAAQTIDALASDARFYITCDLTIARDNVMDDLYVGPA